MQYDAQNCIDCGACVAVCPHSAHGVHAQQGHFFLREKCTACGACVPTCFAGALSLCGKPYAVQDVLDEVLRDSGLYKKSGGGVTFSGGEPLLQAAFVSEAAQALQKEGIHVALDSALNVPYASVQKCLPYVDLFLIDFKAFDSAVHKKYTGASNARIKENLVRLSTENKPIFIRMPIMCGVNESVQNHIDTADFLSELENIVQVDLLSYHDLGLSKCASFGLETFSFEAPEAIQMQALKELYEAKGFAVTIS